MERVSLNELGFSSRNEALSFLKKLWHQEKVLCPICGHELELLHKKAKKNLCDWQCRNCGKTYKTIYLAENGYANDITSTRLHHEIYLSDPRKTDLEKLKTVIRHPIKKK